MELSLAQIEQAAGAPFVHAGTLLPISAEVRERHITGWSIDSRSTEAGDLFFALIGDHLDGHAFVPHVLEERRATAAVINEPVGAKDGLLLQVPDVIAVLGQIAAASRASSRHPLVAITGSAGKTGTKDIVAALLGVRFRVGKTAGNLNNHLGLPLTLLRLPSDSEVAVVELGMNHAGEIRSLAAIARPQVGVVTNVGYAHIEAFESIDGIAAAKRELIESLGPGGTAVLNADDTRVLPFRDVHTGPVVTFAIDAPADVRALNLSSDLRGSSFTVDGVEFRTVLTGRHAVLNILAGLAVARVFGVPLEQLRGAVGNLVPGKMRGVWRQTRGITVLDDSYNSNPEAARAMLDVLLRESSKRKVAVLGEMLELGAWSEALHRQIGRYAADNGVDVLVGVGGNGRHMVAEAADAGIRQAFFFENASEAGLFLRTFVQGGDAVLFKGSRGTHVEQALATMENQ